MTQQVFSPPECRDMIVLDRSKFHKVVHLAAAQVEPKSIPVFRRICAKDILSQARLRTVYDRQGVKLIALRPEITPQNLSDLHAESQSYIDEQKIPIVELDVDLTYDYWQADDILSAILPESLVPDSPAGFTMVGHIAHMNLREDYLPYKSIIGQVILDKNSAIKTVVNKLDTIDSVYRNFQMEILAGENNLIAEQFESGCKFRFDFSKVYWNSRLHTEHERLVRLFEPGDAVCDVMAGVGPFAIPAAKKRVIVFANDLNPASYTSLLDNVQLNRVETFVIPSNVDGRKLIRDSQRLLQNLADSQPYIELDAKQGSRKRRRSENSTITTDNSKFLVPKSFKHYVMNLPASAIEFLDAFKGLYTGLADETPLPKIHVHCFTKYEGLEAQSDLRSRIGSSLGHDMKETEIAYHHVRRVAPSKDMYCCSFTLPAEVAYAS
ncbi:tRNA (guanine-N(1)-)-methyltransferase [Taphrina deformans PYCC 5710]|uniref:tRNA (guanine(37)-N1)-methyltransferase n=1 Tax=Taphrina deformans (strain PYCC 5710 / ATCC 11124 / CBS 356.35 / IMI 108563 / JCM 9778 / NBRC 8474) TaxID=1097556 RepID=R4XEB5_TAPDE|nr:tRNA (guanine-N(1)-)-methyltransferase [Taphrina deformans PYCC 5710]|eukprot:CCG82811.1 tRNA (guanine-N(1)-)-methyltransferase [Taphrina deformans PYCC 5710]